MRKTIIELKSADLTLGNAAASVHVLKDIDLTIAEGEAVGIIRLRQVDAADGSGGP